jgi:hypothetical protein
LAVRPLSVADEPLKFRPHFITRTSQIAVFGDDLDAQLCGECGQLEPLTLRAVLLLQCDDIRM